VIQGITIKGFNITTFELILLLLFVGFIFYEGSKLFYRLFKIAGNIIRFLIKEFMQIDIPPQYKQFALVNIIFVILLLLSTLFSFFCELVPPIADRIGISNASDIKSDISISWLCLALFFIFMVISSGIMIYENKRASAKKIIKDMSNK